MKPIVIGCILILLLLVTIIFYSCSRRITRRLLTENKVYQWKVYHTTENNFPAGKQHYFEVYYGKTQLVLPREMTGGVRDVCRFLAAGAYDAGAAFYDSVLILFETATKDERGFEQRGQMSISVRPEPGRTGQLIVTDLNTGNSFNLTLK
jgi:hypothetical protein